MNINNKNSLSRLYLYICSYISAYDKIKKEKEAINMSLGTYWRTWMEGNGEGQEGGKRDGKVRPFHFNYKHIF